MPPKKKGRAGKSREKPQITPDATPTKQMKSSRRWVVPREEETDRDCEEVFENGDLTTAPKTLFTKKAKQLASRSNATSTPKKVVQPQTEAEGSRRREMNSPVRQSGACGGPKQKKLSKASHLPQSDTQYARTRSPPRTSAAMLGSSVMNSAAAKPPPSYKQRGGYSPERLYTRKAESPSPVRHQDRSGMYFSKPRGRPGGFTAYDDDEDAFASPPGSHILQYLETHDEEDDVDDEYADTEYESGAEVASEHYNRPSIKQSLARLDRPCTSTQDFEYGRNTPRKSTYVPRKGAGRKWTTEKLEHLCVLWEEERHLYDASDVNYKNVRMRENSYDRMAAILDMEVEDVTTRLKSLRNMFRKALKVPSGAPGDSLTAAQKEVLKMCSFLRTHLRSQPTYSSLPAVSAPKQSKRSSPARSKAASIKESEDERSTCAFDDIDDTPGSKHTPTKGRPSSRASSKEGRKTSAKGKSDETAQFMSNLSSTVTEVAHIVKDNQKPPASSQENPVKQTDVEDMWASCLASKVRLLSEMSRLEFKVKVDTLVLEHIRQEQV